MIEKSTPGEHDRRFRSNSEFLQFDRQSAGKHLFTEDSREHRDYILEVEGKRREEREVFAGFEERVEICRISESEVTMG